jgi:hypothetical protein
VANDACGGFSARTAGRVLFGYVVGNAKAQQIKSVTFLSRFGFWGGVESVQVIEKYEALRVARTLVFLVFNEKYCLSRFKAD